MTFKTFIKYRSLVYFIFTFYFAMGVSSYTQLLYFQNNNVLKMFSVYYSVMAIAGASSFVVSNYLNDFSMTWLLRIFIPIYSGALLMRINYSNGLIVVISAALSGISASVVLITMKKWIYSITDLNHEDRGRIHAIRFFCSQLATILSTLIVGMLFAYMVSRITDNLSYRLILIIAPCLMMTNIFLQIPDVEGEKKKEKHVHIKLPQNKPLAIGIYTVYVGMGISAAIISSILPAIIHKNGWSVPDTSLIITLISISTLILAYFYQLPVVTRNAKNVFMIMQILAIFICGWSLILKSRMITVLIIGFVTEGALAGFFILKELTEYEIVPNQERLIYLGLMQSSFLVGDSFGSPIGSYVFESKGLITLVGVYCVFTAVFSVAFYLLVALNNGRDKVGR